MRLSEIKKKIQKKKAKVNMNVDNKHFITHKQSECKGRVIFLIMIAEVISTIFLLRTRIARENNCVKATDY